MCISSESFLGLRNSETAILFHKKSDLLTMEALLFTIIWYYQFLSIVENDSVLFVNDLKQIIIVYGSNQ